MKAAAPIYDPKKKLYGIVFKYLVFKFLSSSFCFYQ